MSHNTAMPEQRMSPRKTTRIIPCTNHAGVFAGMTRRRQAEVVCEGGPAGGPCSPVVCEVRPGTDFFAEWALLEVAAMPHLWAVNRPA